MKHAKKLLIVLISDGIIYATYIAALFYKFQIALNLLPFYLTVISLVITGFSMLLFSGLVLDAFSNMGKVELDKVKDYQDFRAKYSWSYRLNVFVAVIFALAFASQSLYLIAALIVLKILADALLFGVNQIVFSEVEKHARKSV